MAGFGLTASGIAAKAHTLPAGTAVEVVTEAPPAADPPRNHAQDLVRFLPFGPYPEAAPLPPVPPIMTVHEAMARMALLHSTLATPPASRPAGITAKAAVGDLKSDDMIRCTGDGGLCIRAATYTEDVCTAIDHSASKAGIDPHFLARLLWQESLFEPAAISPVGAQGIAQFMPSTAAMVGLDDPWNPAKSIEASAQYLRKLRDGFGNLGLAAVAYNGGENRAANFINRGAGLPYETRAYVAAITGHDAATWRDAPPASVDLRLAGDKPFRTACTELAAGRGIRSFAPPVPNWAVIVASHPQRDRAQTYASQLQSRLRPILGGQPVVVRRAHLTGAGKAVYTAQIGYDSRQGAMRFCNRLKQAGGRCIVLRN